MTNTCTNISIDITNEKIVMTLSDGAKHQMDINFDIIDDFDLVGAVAHAMEQHACYYESNVYNGRFACVVQHAKELFQRKMFTRRPSRLKHFPHILQNTEKQQNQRFTRTPHPLTGG